MALSKWSELHEDVLTIVVKFLSLPDQNQFGEVCKSWRRAMVAHRCLYHPPPLLLTRSSKSDNDKNTSHNLDFLYLGQGQDECRKLSNISLCSRRDEHRVQLYGPTHGWLLFNAEPFRANYLLNPISGQQFNLPYMDDGGMQIILTGALSSPPSSRDCVMVAQEIFIDPQGLPFTRVVSCSPAGGDRKWNILIDSTGSTLSSKYICMIFYKNKLFMMRGDNGSTSVCAFDFRGSAIDQAEQTITLPAEISSDHFHFLRYIESLNGELLLVSKVVDRVENFLSSVVVVVGFQVFQLEEEGKRWIRITNLGDQALLVSSCRLESISSKDFKAPFRSNCIYDISASNSTVSVYSMEDECFRESISLPDRIHGVDWVMPQGW